MSQVHGHPQHYLRTASTHFGVHRDSALLVVANNLPNAGPRWRPRSFRQGDAKLMVLVLNGVHHYRDHLPWFVLLEAHHQWLAERS
jgi:hypothetical protein